MQDLKAGHASIASGAATTQLFLYERPEPLHSKFNQASFFRVCLVSCSINVCFSPCLLLLFILSSCPGYSNQDKVYWISLLFLNSVSRPLSLLIQTTVWDKVAPAILSLSAILLFDALLQMHLLFIHPRSVECACFPLMFLSLATNIGDCLSFYVVARIVPLLCRRFLW